MRVLVQPQTNIVPRSRSAFSARRLRDSMTVWRRFGTRLHRLALLRRRARDSRLGPGIQTFARISPHPILTPMQPHLAIHQKPAHPEKKAGCQSQAESRGGASKFSSCCRISGVRFVSSSVSSRVDQALSSTYTIMACLRSCTLNNYKGGIWPKIGDQHKMTITCYLYPDWRGFISTI